MLTLPFADGEYRFELHGKRIDELEAKCKAGLGEIYSRTMSGLFQEDEGFGVDPFAMQWKWIELREIIRQALIGGGGGESDGSAIEMTDFLANRFVTNYLEKMPKSEVLKMCAGILHDTFDGYEAPKKEEPVKPAPEK